ncbi:hypothetical protein SAMN05444146_3371 [Flavobacterium johnsoniae]|nr:hypothetical protein SAMN05444146_3371 [Flavobacterium johnsoniae]
MPLLRFQKLCLYVFKKNLCFNSMLIKTSLKKLQRGVYIYPITSSIEAPKLICSTFPFGVTKAGTDFIPAF